MQNQIHYISFIYSIIFQNNFPNYCKSKKGGLFYKTEIGEHAEQFRDVLKTYSGANLSLLSLGIENQSEEDAAMPIRIMGYEYGTYRGMVKNKKLITPVTTIVLNFGEKRWSKAKSLHELMQLPDGLKAYVEDYKIRVYDIAFLSDNVIERFASDFKIVARFFKDRRLKKNTLRKDEMAKIYHAEALLDLFSVFTKDDRYRSLYTEAMREKEKKEEGIDMCWMFQEIFDEGIEQGVEKGIEKGLAALITSLKAFVPDVKELHKLVTANETYAHITEEQVRAYYES